VLLDLLDGRGHRSRLRRPRRASRWRTHWAVPVLAWAYRVYDLGFALATAAGAVLLPLYALLAGAGQQHVVVAVRITGLCLLPELRRPRPGRIALILAAGVAAVYSGMPDPAIVIVAVIAARALAVRACMRLRPPVPARAASASASGMHPGRAFRMHPPADTDADTAPAPAASAGGYIRDAAGTAAVAAPAHLPAGVEEWRHVPGLPYEVSSLGRWRTPMPIDDNAWPPQQQLHPAARPYRHTGCHKARASAPGTATRCGRIQRPRPCPVFRLR
jgi:hypothetical protein